VDDNESSGRPHNLDSQLTEAPEVRYLHLRRATADALRPFGLLLPAESSRSLPIPYYPGRVEEGALLDLRYRGRLVARTATIHPGDEPARWLERHLHLNQLFVNLSIAPFAMILAPPNHQAGCSLPDVDSCAAFSFPPASALLLHRGTWHDFPIALTSKIVILTFSSEEVIEALTEVSAPGEIHKNDVEKIALGQRFGLELRLSEDVPDD
jgi:ureidoglycolate lyase